MNLSLLKIGHPSFLNIERRKTNFARKMENGLATFFFILLLGNIYGYYLLFLEIPSEKFNEIGLLAFNFSIILHLLKFYLISLQDQSSIIFFEKLERDIILHEIENTEIKKRLEENIFGQEFGGWITNKLEMVRERGKVILKNNENMDDRIRNLEEIGSEMKFEREGRIREFEENYKKDFEEYSTELKKLIKWINMLINSGVLFDDYLVKIIKTTLEDLNNLDKEISSSCKSALMKFNNIKI